MVAHSAENDALIEGIMSILGYTAETQAPNTQPTNEYVTDRWMKPRRDALVAFIRERMAQAWDFGYACGLGDYGKNDDETMSANPYGVIPPGGTDD